MSDMAGVSRLSRPLAEELCGCAITVLLLHGHVRLPTLSSMVDAVDSECWPHSRTMKAAAEGNDLHPSQGRVGNAQRIPETCSYTLVSATGTARQQL